METIDGSREATADDPRAAGERHFFAGVELLEKGENGAAERCFREALALVPDLAEAAGNLGYLLDKRGARDEAETWLRRAIELDPDCLEVTLTLGALLTTLKRFKEAEAVCMRAIALAPESPQTWTNLGVLFASVKREAEAEQCQRTAMALDPGHLTSRFNLAYVLLRQGRYTEGWECLEARRWYAAFAACMPCPRWQGEALAGKSLLIGFEAGHGDMIQFVRYVDVLRSQGTRGIDLVCHPPLKALFEGQCGIDHVYAFDETIQNGTWDCWTPPMSIPHYCRTTLDTIPARIPYLVASPERVAAWQKRLPPGRPRVGLAWKGNPRFENDADRSLPSLNTLAPLGDVPGIHFVSLQKGAGEDEARHPPPGLRLANLGPEFKDFADTAAVVSQLDLVVTVDTAIAHLAGALGVPCWIMLPYYQTDWRWLTEREDSPWYPGVVRLFRQTSMGEWDPVISRLSDAVALLFHEGRVGNSVPLAKEFPGRLHRKE